MSTNTKHRPVIGGLQQKTTSRKLATTFKHGPVQGATMLLIALALANASRCLVQTDDLTSSNIKHYKTVITNTWDHLVFLWCLVCIDNIEGSYLYYLVPISWSRCGFAAAAYDIALDERDDLCSRDGFYRLLNLCLAFPVPRWSCRVWMCWAHVGIEFFLFL